MSIKLTINGQCYEGKTQTWDFNVNYYHFYYKNYEIAVFHSYTLTVDPKFIPMALTLNIYLREYAELTGTKFMCLEGGCGVCIVSARIPHPGTGKMENHAVNSCLVLIMSCDGWEVTTIEGIGSVKDGYHPIQMKLASMDGSQCGFCSPGMVMNMYCLMYKNNANVDMKEVELAFGGNICRCTGYRPILDAMKSFANFVEKDYDVCNDIEDLKVCTKSGQSCGGKCIAKSPRVELNLTPNESWFSATTMEQIFEQQKRIGNKPQMIVAGNTGHGVYRRDPEIRNFIDINGVAELRAYSLGQQITLGSLTTLTDLIEIMTTAAEFSSDFKYCNLIADHLNLVANIPVRNRGTIGGNLMLKHKHPEFQSDIFLLMETIGAFVVIAESVSNTKTISLMDFLKTNMSRKVIRSLILPPLSKKFLFRSYKIMPRAQNAVALVNAGFLIKINRRGMVEYASICFGNISRSFVHAYRAEKSLRGKDLFKTTTLQDCIRAMEYEITPDWVRPNPSADYRKHLAISLFYKFVLLQSDQINISPFFRSGAENLSRSLSSGSQTYETNKTEHPINQPVQKLEALVQCAGEAKYVNDLPRLKNELHSAFVLSRKGATNLGKIDARDALKIPGVVAFYSAKDIPGKNNFAVSGLFAMFEEEEIFASKEIRFNGQPLGVIVAETFDLAYYAATKVRVVYVQKEDGKNKIYPTVAEVLKNEVASKLYISEPKEIICKPHGNAGLLSIFNKTKPTAASKRIRGHFSMNGQYHFSMETLGALCVPNEDGLDVYATTQYIDLTQNAIALCLNVPQHSVNLMVRRCGGGFGIKISRSTQCACACAIAAALLHRPVRMQLTIEDTMKSTGKRYPILSDYEVEMESNGKITKLTNTYTEDYGCSLNEPPGDFFTTRCFRNVYDNTGWVVKQTKAKTNAPSNTWCRAPGTCEAIAMVENIMEHVARECNLDPIEVRMANIREGHKVKELMPKFLADCNFYIRRTEIDDFNKENRWMKRGIAICPLEFPIDHFGNFPAIVTIYHYDGTVAVSHGGIEIGQGINTKAAQVAAHTLGVPLEFVKIKPSNNLVSGNAFVTGASVTSEAVAFAVLKACEAIVNRIKPVRDKMPNAKWPLITQACQQQNISLIEHYTFTSEQVESYYVYGISCSEIKMDILTGQVIVERVDILEDTGESLSPRIDVGQIEGAFIMGLGYWLSEKLVYDIEDGELVTDRTWNYHPPGARDIPVDYRITLLQKSVNPFGVLRSKATGEPPLLMSVSALFACRYALDSARRDADVHEKWFNLGAPATSEDLFLAAETLSNSYSY